MHELLSHPVVQGAIAGALAAASVDFAAFRAWQRWQDVAAYSWATATFRWVQGAIVGVVSAAGLGVLLGG